MVFAGNMPDTGQAKSYDTKKEIPYQPDLEPLSNNKRSYSSENLVQKDNEIDYDSIDLSTSDYILQSIIDHPKLRGAKYILKDFIDGKEKANVIINIKENSPKGKSLKDINARIKLQKAIKTARDKIIPGLDTQKIHIRGMVFH